MWDYIYTAKSFIVLNIIYINIVYLHNRRHPSFSSLFTAMERRKKRMANNNEKKKKKKTDTLQNCK